MPVRQLQFSPTLLQANALQRYALHLHRFNISDRFIKPGNKFGVWTASAPNRTADDEVILQSERDNQRPSCSYAVLGRETRIFATAAALTNRALVGQKLRGKVLEGSLAIVGLPPPMNCRLKSLEG